MRNIDLKNEILENEDISIVGGSAFIKQLLFDVCKEKEFIFTDDFQFSDEYICLSRINNKIIIESIKDKYGDYLYHEAPILWLADEVLQDALALNQTNRFLTDRNYVFLY